MLDKVRLRVREVIRRSGRSQRQFGDAIGMEPTKLSKSLTGVRRFTPTELVTIADFTGVPVNWLLNGQSADAPTPLNQPRSVAVPAPAIPGGAKRPLPAPGYSRERQIIEATHRLIAEAGYYSVRVADVAAACGTSTATVHYYFPTLRALLTAALRHQVQVAFDRQVAGLHDIADPVERLHRLIDLQLPHAGHVRQEWSIWLQMWAAASLDTRMRALYRDFYQRWHEVLADTLREGQDQGAFRAFDVVTMTTRLTALIDGLGIQVLVGKSDTLVADMRRTLYGVIEADVLKS